MKRLTALTPADLERVAVWLHDGAGDDFARVKATERAEISERDSDTFIARTQFVLANGAQYVGFCSPSSEDAMDVLQPVIVTTAGLVYFYFEEPPSNETLDRQWNRLGAGHEEIFPVHFRCLVPLDGRYVTGVIERDDLTGAA